MEPGLKRAGKNSSVVVKQEDADEGFTLSIEKVGLGHEGSTSNWRN